MSNRQKSIARVVFAVYFVLLVWLVLFKFSPNIDSLKKPFHIVEFVPFAARSVGLRQSAKEMLANLLAFVPLGAYLEVFFGSIPRRVLPAVLMGGTASLCFEIVQYAFAIGAADVTDLILNTAGTLLGSLLFLLAERLWRERAVPLLNGIGIAAEAVFFVLFSVVTVGNP